MSERQNKRLAQKEANKSKRRMIEKLMSNSKPSNAAFNLNLLVDGWLELESDPGTFSLLIEDFGCYGAQVDEIYDLEQKIEGPVFGFIFLFKWLNNQPNDRSRNQKSNSTVVNSFDKDNEQQPPEQRQWTFVKDANIIREMFFAKQMISNSCATHALISILLNCDYNELNLGPTLTRLKEDTKILNPEDKGYAIGNFPELAKAHNSHASFSSLYNRIKSTSHSAAGMSYMISGNQRTNLQQQNKHEAYHFVSYVPINNRLYELDGLKNFPIDHGPLSSNEDWTEKFRSVIKQRLLINKSGDDSTLSNDIRYSLLAVVPDKRIKLGAKLKKLRKHHKVIQDSIKRMTAKVFTPLSIDVDIPNPPYSPLSNGTLTASEGGSAHNSPTNLENGFFSDDDNTKIDKYFIIKFNQQAEATDMKDDNAHPAHKNCIIDVKPTNVQPVDLTIDENHIANDDANSKDPEPTEAPPNNIKNLLKTTPLTVGENECSGTNHKQNNLTIDLDKVPTVHGIQTNGSTKDGDVRVNDVPAHNNEKYNLSTMPPFDFNILDEMQHVHFGKSNLRDIKSLSERLTTEIGKFDTTLKEEIDKRCKYKVDNSRRTHNYEPFITTFLLLLAKEGILADLLEKDLGIIKEDPPAAALTSTPITTKTQKPSTSTTSNKVGSANGAVSNKNSTATPKTPITPKSKYIPTGRPVGRPRKNPLPST